LITTNQSLEKFGELKIDDYVDIVRNVWTNIHPRRTVIDYALHVFDHASKLGEAIRKKDADLILTEIAETLNWLFAFVAKLNDFKTGWENKLNIKTNFSRMIWDKYPNICPHCFERIYILNNHKITTNVSKIAIEIKGKCKYCLVDYPKVEERSITIMADSTQNYDQLKRLSKKELRNYAQKTLEEIPNSLQGMETMFHKIYESNTALTTLEGIGFHLLEETGEMGRAVIDIYTNKRTDKSLEEKHHDLCDEVAEVFGWLCSLTLKVRDEAKTFDKYRNRLVTYVLPLKANKSEKLADYIGLEEILWLTYRNEKNKQYTCPYCKFTICKCELEFAWEKKSINTLYRDQKSLF
jgi:NTP pyrophosphatase (non-canonical NTP hydrolase)